MIDTREYLDAKIMEALNEYKKLRSVTGRIREMGQRGIAKRISDDIMRELVLPNEAEIKERQKLGQTL